MENIVSLKNDKHGFCGLRTIAVDELKDACDFL